MKLTFKTKDITKLYDITVDTLRYYEKKGLIVPSRSDNNYRIYTLSDINRLNIIQDLKNLDMNVSDIKTYLDTQSLETSIKLIDDELNHLSLVIETLLKKKRSLDKRHDNIQYISTLPFDTVFSQSYDTRYGFELSTSIRSDDEADLAIKKLHHMYKLKDLGSLSIASTLDLDHNDTFKNIFFIDTQDGKNEPLLKEGTYISIVYAGPYTQSSKNVKKLLQYINKNQYTIIGDPFEIYHIDNRFTQNPKEFITEIQICVDMKGIRHDHNI